MTGFRAMHLLTHRGNEWETACGVPCDLHDHMVTTKPRKVVGYGGCKACARKLPTLKEDDRGWIAPERRNPR